MHSPVAHGDAAAGRPGPRRCRAGAARSGTAARRPGSARRSRSEGDLDHAGVRRVAFSGTRARSRRSTEATEGLTAIRASAGHRDPQRRGHRGHRLARRCGCRTWRATGAGVQGRAHRRRSPCATSSRYASSHVPGARPGPCRAGRPARRRVTPPRATAEDACVAPMWWSRRPLAGAGPRMVRPGAQLTRSAPAPAGATRHCHRGRDGAVRDSRAVRTTRPGIPVRRPPGERSPVRSIWLERRGARAARAGRRDAAREATWVRSLGPWRRRPRRAQIAVAVAPEQGLGTEVEL